ncbi:MAG: acetyl-CoA carboxylase carboxyl transferase subunit alpha, partial [Planctomycetota bacterium]
ISPEGCASILFRDGDRKQEAANGLRITAGDLRRMGLIDEIIEEPLGGAHHDPRQAALLVEAFFANALREMKPVAIDTLLQRRYSRFRQIGNCFTTLRLAKTDGTNAATKKDLQS